MSAPSNSAQAAKPGLVKFAWLHMACMIPSDWEPVAYSSAESGRMEFANRNGHQARLAWMKCKNPPDCGRMMEEFQRRRLKSSSKEDFLSFNGLSLRQAGQFSFGIYKNSEPCQAAIYHPSIKTMSLWTFPSFSEEAFSSVWLPLLESFSLNDGGWHDWAIWGLDFKLPSDFILCGAHPLPANLTLSFESPRRIRADFHRWGLPQIFLGSRNLEDFYRHFLSSGRCRICDVKTSTLKSMEAVEIDFEQRGEFDMDRLYGRWWKGRGVCWHDKASMRIHAFEQSGSRKAPKLEFGDVFSQLG